jgi:hypothetical protein
LRLANAGGVTPPPQILRKLPVGRSSSFLASLRQPPRIGSREVLKQLLENTAASNFNNIFIFEKSCRKETDFAILRAYHSERQGK